jgi:hypothetical protein
MPREYSLSSHEETNAKTLNIVSQTEAHNHPSKRPNLRNSCRVHVDPRDLSLSLSFSRSLPLPLSGRPLWIVLTGRAGGNGSTGVRVGGEADNGTRCPAAVDAADEPEPAPPVVGEAAMVADTPGNERRYHPPVHVSATS